MNEHRLVLANRYGRDDNPDGPRHRCHEKAKVAVLDSGMSKAPKNPSQQSQIKRWKDEGDASRSKSAHKPRSSPKRKAETVLDAVSAETPNGVMEAPEAGTAPSLSPVHDNPPASAHSLMAAGNQIGEDQPSPHGGIRDESKQQVQAVPTADRPAPEEPDQGITSDLPQSSESVGEQADLKQEPTKHHPMVYELNTEIREDRKGWFSTGLEGAVRQAIRAWSPRLRGASDRVKGASGRVKVWAQERTARRAQESGKVQEAANPIYILAAITLGIPAVLLIPLVGMNPAIQDGTFVTVLSFLILSAIVTAVIFEIKRLVDQPSDQNSH